MWYASWRQGSMYFAALLGLAGSLVLFLLHRKTRRLSKYIDELTTTVRRQEEAIAKLTARAYRLERTIGIDDTRVSHPVSVSAANSQELVPQEAPTVSDRILLSKEEDRDDWEAVVGANWLNRIGALVLVIGIALFLAYSFTQLGAGGKVVIGFATGVSMLAAGMALRRRERYSAFSMNLTAGGWAVIYFTTYAMHGLGAARIIESPVLGAGALLIVSAAMLGHALFYRSERATALAYLFGFVSLNATVITSFSIVATLCLAASLVALADRFAWPRLVLAGVLLSYSSFVLRYDAGIYGTAGLLNGQVILWTYWTVFEGFDLVDLWRRGTDRGIERSLFPLNACGFIGASILLGMQMRSEYWVGFFAAASAAYLISSVLRARIIRSDEASPLSTALGSGYEGAAAASAFLMAAAAVKQFDGAGLTIALLMEGEFIVLTAIALGNQRLRWLGGAVLALPFLHLITGEIHSDSRGLMGLRIWSPAALLAAGTYGVNRFALGGSWPYAAGAAILVAIVMHAELGRLWVAVAWAALGLLAIVAGERLGHRDLRIQSCMMAAAVLSRTWIVNLTAASPTLRVGTTCAVIGAYYASEFLVRKQETLKTYFSLCGTLLLTLLLFNEVQGRLLTVAWGVQGALLLLAGFLSGERILRLSGLVVFLLCIGKLFVYDVRELDIISRILSFIVLGVMLLAASWVYTRFRDRIRRLL